MWVAQPATYVSSSGDYALSVDPEGRMGRAGAMYRLRKGGSDVWSAKKEYTLREVSVTDDGIVVGFAYRGHDPDQYFHFVILDATGREILDEMESRCQRESSTPPRPNRPYAKQLIALPDHDRAVLRIVEADGFTRWRIYELSTGKLVDRRKPGGLVLGARLVEDRPLVLVHEYLGRRRMGAVGGVRFVLMNLEGDPVWSFDAVRDYVGIELFEVSLVGRRPEDYFREHPGILLTEGSGRFDVRLFATNERVSFVVKSGANGEWIVSETERVDFVADDQGGSADSPLGALRYLGELILSSPQSDRLGRMVGFAVDSQDQLYAVSKWTGAVHVFDRFGKWLRMMEPDPTDFGGTVEEAFVAVTLSGEVYVQRPKPRGPSPPDEYLRFSASGERIGFVTFEPRLGGSPFSPSWAFQPATGYRCGIRHLGNESKLMIVDPPDTVVREVSKRANGKWFDVATAFAMGPDGSMAVLSHELGGASGVSEIDLFSPDGEPIRSILLPRAKKWYCGLACEGRRVVVVGQEEVVIVNLDGDEMERWSLEGANGARRRWSAFIVGDGRELLLFDGRMRFESGSPTIHRYALP